MLGCADFVENVLHLPVWGIIIKVTFENRRMCGMATVTKDTLIGDILDLDRDTAPYFLEMGMHCLGCPSARGESLEEACLVHGVDVDEMLLKINRHLADK